MDILDNGQYKLRKKKIDLPMEGHDKICTRAFVMTGNKMIDMMIVYGFVKKEFIKNEMKSPSNDILDLVTVFYESNFAILHLLRSYHYVLLGYQYKNYHYTLDLGFL